MKKSLRSHRLRRPNAGFTLMEVLMVTVLLFYLVYVTFTTVRDLMEAKTRIDYRTDLGQVQRSLWSIMDRDLRNAFYITAEDLGWNPQPASAQPQSQDGTPPPPAVKPVPVTIFQGTLNEIMFTTRSHQRMSQDVPEDEQHYVRYMLENGKLIRSETERAINRDDLTNSKAFKEFTLLENVKTLEFKYYDMANEQWLESWDANKAESLDKLPAAVQFKVVFTPKVEDDPDAKPAPVEISTMIRITQRIFKEAPFVLPTKNSAAPAPVTGR